MLMKCSNPQMTKWSHLHMLAAGVRRILPFWGGLAIEARTRRAVRRVLVEHVAEQLLGAVAEQVAVAHDRERRTTRVGADADAEAHAPAHAAAHAAPDPTSDASAVAAADDADALDVRAVRQADDAAADRRVRGDGQTRVEQPRRKPAVR